MRHSVREKAHVRFIAFIIARPAGSLHRCSINFYFPPISSSAALGRGTPLRSLPCRVCLVDSRNSADTHDPQTEGRRVRERKPTALWELVLLTSARHRQTEGVHPFILTLLLQSASPTHPVIHPPSGNHFILSNTNSKPSHHTALKKSKHSFPRHNLVNSTPLTLVHRADLSQLFYCCMNVVSDIREPLHMCPG